MTVEEILAAMQAIIDSARDAETGEEAPLTEEQAERYEELERQLNVARKSQEIVKRNAAYRTATTPAVFNAADKKVSEYERAFVSYLRTGQKNGDLIERAQSEGVGSAGGFLVPDTWRDKIVEKLVTFGGLMNAAEKLNTSDGRALSWITNDEAPTTATAGNYAEITPENELWDTGADLAFGTRSLGAYKYTTVGANNLPLKISYELLQDSAFDLRGFVSKKFADRIARKLARDLVLGTGIGEPQGIISTQGGLSSATAFTGAAPTYAELLAAVHTMDPAYRDGASWLFNDATLAKIRGIVGTDGRPLLWNNNETLAGSLQGMTLLGYPVVIDQAMPNFTDGSANKWGVFGNLNDAYVVREVKAFEMVVLNELYAQYGQVGFMGWARYDGMVQDPNAAVLLVND